MNNRRNALSKEQLRYFGRRGWIVGGEYRTYHDDEFQPKLYRVIHETPELKEHLDLILSPAFGAVCNISLCHESGLVSVVNTQKYPAKVLEDVTSLRDSERAQRLAIHMRAAVVASKSA